MATVTLNTGSGVQQWTPPGDCATLDLLELWGPGGSGANETAARTTGGGSGAYNAITGPITIASLLASSGLSTVPYLLGQGGAAVSAANTVGNPGSAKTSFLVPGAIAVDAVNSAAAIATAATTVSNTNLTVSAGATSLAAILCFEDATDPTSITVNWDAGGTPQALTQVLANTGGTSLTTFIFGLVSPTPGNKMLTASWTNAQNVVCGVVSFNNTISSSVANCFSNGGSGQGSGTTATPSVGTGAVGQLGISAIGAATAITSQTGTSATAIMLNNAGSMGGAALVLPETGSTTTVNCSLTGSQNYCYATANVKPAVAPYSADFGLGGKTAGSGTAAGGTGGLASASVPSGSAINGANGGTSTVTTGASGGGASGSGAGAAVAGAAVTTAVAGAGGTAPSGGGNGGAGSITAANATAGSTPGGGGGAHLTGTGNSGAGGIGQIVITYTPAVTAPFPPWLPPGFLQLGA